MPKYDPQKGEFFYQGSTKYVAQANLSCCLFL
jgi:hypothetical protein